MEVNCGGRYKGVENNQSDISPYETSRVQFHGLISSTHAYIYYPIILVLNLLQEAYQNVKKKLLLLSK